MGRRSTHSAGELRQLILASTREIVEKHGLAELSAREIARKIDYSPGTIYNVFKNLDDLLLTIQVDMLRDVVGILEAVPKDVDERTYLKSLARRYMDFALTHRRLWNLLFQHQLPNGAEVPHQLHNQIAALVAIVAQALKPLLAKSADATHTARLVWASVHGISAIAVTDKGPTMTTQTAQAYVADLIEVFLAGLKQP